MEVNVFHIIDPVTILILTTTVHQLITPISKNQIRILVILVTALLTEIANSLLLYYGKPIKLTSTVSVILTDMIWLSLLTDYVYKRSAARFLLAAFLLYSIVNVIFLEGINEFNSNTFIVGSLLYLIIFIYSSFLRLKNEKLSFFLNNYYLLLCCPIIYFLGFSFLFGFSSKAVNSYVIFGNLKLYAFVMYFVNIVYYSLINIYIYREKKLHNAR